MLLSKGHCALAAVLLKMDRPVKALLARVRSCSWFFREKPGRVGLPPEGSRGLLTTVRLACGWEVTRFPGDDHKWALLQTRGSGKREVGSGYLLVQSKGRQRVVSHWPLSWPIFPEDILASPCMPDSHESLIPCPGRWQ